MVVINQPYKVLSVTVPPELFDQLTNEYSQTGFYREAGGQLIVEQEEDGEREIINRLAPSIVPASDEQSGTDISFDS
jgi:curved DNA-binding protein CbpA